MDTVLLIFIVIVFIMYILGFIVLDWKDKNASLWFIAMLAIPILGSLAYLTYKQRYRYYKN